MAARAREILVRHEGVGRTAFTYAPSSKRTSHRPAASSRNSVTGPTVVQVCRWNRVRRLTGTGLGYGLRPMSPIVVPLGSSATVLRAGSLNVFIRHVVPPQRAELGAATCNPAAAAPAAPAARKRRAKIPARFMNLAARMVTPLVGHGLLWEGRGRGGIGKRAGFRSQWGASPLQVQVLSPALARRLICSTARASARSSKR